MLCRSLKGLGIDAHGSGRNDIHVGERKVSGSAFRYTGDVALHHGTFLLNVEMERMTKYLNPNKKKLESKGVKSIAARVLNLNEVDPTITHERLCHSLAKEFMSTCVQEYSNEEKYLPTDQWMNDISTKGRGDASNEMWDSEIVEIGEEFVQENEFTKKIHDTLLDWQWRFGMSPQFTHEMEERFPWGSLHVHIDSSAGIIKDVKIFSDTLYPDLIDVMMECLQNKHYSTEGQTEIQGERTLPCDPCVDHLQDAEQWLKRAI